MRKKVINEKYMVTISSKDFAQKTPSSFVIRKSSVVVIVVLILLVFGFTAYIGVGALMSTSKLESTTSNLESTLKQQYDALQQNSGQIERLNENQQNIIDQLEGMLPADAIKEMSAVNRTQMVIGSRTGMADVTEAPADIRTIKQSMEYGSGSVNSVVELIGWFDGGSKVFPRYTEAVVIDVETGRSFNVRRFGGTFHADSEPLTAEDTAIMKEIFGGAWTWDRRAIWVKIGDRFFAASMHGMPHMVNPTQSNNFPGHFCIHFLHSMVHATSRECPRHQEMVMEAFTSASKLDEYMKTNQY